MPHVRICATLRMQTMIKEKDLRLPWRAVEFEQANIGAFGRGPRVCYLVEDRLGIVIALFEDIEVAKIVVKVVNESGGIGQALARQLTRESAGATQKLRRRDRRGTGSGGSPDRSDRQGSDSSESLAVGDAEKAA